QRACLLSHEDAMGRRAPVGESVSARNIVWKRIGLSGPERRLQNAPDAFVVVGRGRTNIHYCAASCAGPRVSFGLSAHASSQLNTFNDFTNLPTPSVCAQSKPSSMISSSLKCFESSWYTSSLSTAYSPCLNRSA